MTTKIVVPFALTSVALGCILATTPSFASKETKDYIIPDTSIAQSGDAGRFMHTNFVISKHPRLNGIAPNVVPAGLTPPNILSAYGVTPGGGGAIAIVDAYSYATALTDFNTYAKADGIPQETLTNVTASTNKVFEVVYGSGTKPKANSGWSQEEALDIEISHAMAPNAKIYLVEASSASDAGLYQAVAKAAEPAWRRRNLDELVRWRVFD